MATEDIDTHWQCRFGLWHSRDYGCECLEGKLGDSVSPSDRRAEAERLAEHHENTAIPPRVA